MNKMIVSAVALALVAGGVGVATFASRATPTGAQTTGADGLRGCQDKDDADAFNRASSALDMKAMNEFIGSGKCTYVAAGEPIFVEDSTLTGRVRFRERGSTQLWWSPAK